MSAQTTTATAANAAAPTTSTTTEATLPKLGLLEEDDEFEEFPVEGKGPSPNGGLMLPHCIRLG